VQREPLPGLYHKAVIVGDTYAITTVENNIITRICSLMLLNLFDFSSSIDTVDTLVEFNL